MYLQPIYARTEKVEIRMCPSRGIRGTIVRNFRMVVKIEFVKGPNFSIVRKIKSCPMAM